MSDMAIILSITKNLTMWRRNLKSLSDERGWVKSAENLSASPFQTNVSSDTIFSQVYVAGQSL